MISRTKYLMDDEKITAMFKKAGIEGISKIAELGAGEYNAVYEVIADKAYVLKIAPKSDVPVLTYEKNMMQSEVYWYSIIREHTSIKVPDVYYSDFTRELIPSDWFIMEKLEGRQRNEMQIDRTVVTQKTAEMLAQIHGIQNDKFGYVQNALYDNWYDALRSMIQNLLGDAARVNKKSRNGERLLCYTEKYREILSNVPCCMVNYDLWDMNVICKTNKNNEIEFQWIDPERSFWGDRIFDFVCLENPIAMLNKKTASIHYYNRVSTQSIDLNRETQIRFAFAIGLLALIQEVEKYYRYTPHHFGWWRNVSGQMVYYKKAFKVLKNG